MYQGIEQAKFDQSQINPRLRAFVASREGWCRDRYRNGVQFHALFPRSLELFKNLEYWSFRFCRRLVSGSQEGLWGETRDWDAIASPKVWLRRQIYNWCQSPASKMLYLCKCWPSYVRKPEKRRENADRFPQMCGVYLIRLIGDSNSFLSRKKASSIQLELWRRPARRCIDSKDPSRLSKSEISRLYSQSFFSGGRQI